MSETEFKKEKCPYCEGRDNKIDPDDPDPNKQSFIEKESVIDMGQFGKLDLDVYQAVTTENKKHYPCISVVLTGYDDHLTDIVYEKFKINFCPVCGRNLTKEYEDMD